MPSYIFYWIISHIVFLLCLVYRAKKQTINFDGKNGIFALYRIAVVSGVLLLLYAVIKTFIGWHFDPWMIEVIWAGVTFTACDIVFIGLRPGNTAPAINNFFTRGYKNLRAVYIVLRLGFFVTIYLRLVMILLSVLSFDPRSIAAYCPDKRGTDLHIYEHYYLDYTARKGVVVVKKYGPFEKDVAAFRSVRSFENGVPEAAVSGDCRAAVVLYPSVTHTGDTIIVQSDPGRYNYVKEYMLIRADKAKQVIVIDLYNNRTAQMRDSMRVQM